MTGKKAGIEWNEMGPLNDDYTMANISTPSSSAAEVPSAVKNTGR